MSKEARLTRIWLRQQILKMLMGQNAGLYRKTNKCPFCLKYGRPKPENLWAEISDCSRCPIFIGLEKESCDTNIGLKFINEWMGGSVWNKKVKKDKAIPGALAIYMWLFEL